MVLQSLNGVNSDIASLIGLTANKILKGNRILGIDGTVQEEDGTRVFNTIEEMKQAQAVDGNLAIIYGPHIKPLEPLTKVESLYLPEEIVLETPVTDPVSVRVINIGSNSGGDDVIQITSSNFSINIFEMGMGDMKSLDVSYTSQDGITYTREDFSVEGFTQIGDVVYIVDPFKTGTEEEGYDYTEHSFGLVTENDYTLNIFKSFFKSDDYTFEGIYEYRNKIDYEYLDAVTSGEYDSSNDLVTFGSNETFVNDFSDKFIQLFDKGLLPLDFANEGNFSAGLFVNPQTGDIYIIQGKRTTYDADSLSYFVGENYNEPGFLLQESSDSSSYPTLSPSDCLYGAYKLNKDTGLFEDASAEILLKVKTFNSKNGNNYYTYGYLPLNSTLGYCGVPEVVENQIGGYNLKKVSFKGLYQYFIRTSTASTSKSNTENIGYGFTSFLGWHHIENHYTLWTPEQLLPGVKAMGKYGDVIGDGSILNNNFGYDILPNVLGDGFNYTILPQRKILFAQANNGNGIKKYQIKRLKKETSGNTYNNPIKYIGFTKGAGVLLDNNKMLNNAIASNPNSVSGKFDEHSIIKNSNNVLTGIVNDIPFRITIPNYVVSGNFAGFKDIFFHNGKIYSIQTASSGTNYSANDGLYELSTDGLSWIKKVAFTYDVHHEGIYWNGKYYLPQGTSIKCIDLSNFTVEDISGFNFNQGYVQGLPSIKIENNLYIVGRSSQATTKTSVLVIKPDNTRYLVTIEAECDSNGTGFILTKNSTWYLFAGVNKPLYNIGQLPNNTGTIAAGSISKIRDVGYTRSDSWTTKEIIYCDETLMFRRFYNFNYFATPNVDSNGSMNIGSQGFFVESIMPIAPLSPLTTDGTNIYEIELFNEAANNEVSDVCYISNTLSADIGSSNGIAYIVSGNSGLNDSEYNNALETTEEILGNTQE